MLKGEKILGIIPARGGSKGISGKNIKLLDGKPLISYTIVEALKSKYIDKLIVSTDDTLIAEISKQYGAEIPFIRPAELALDATPGIDPILHSINWFKDNGQNFDYVICLQCTSPFRKAEHIDSAIEELLKDTCDSVVSICESEVSPYWMKRLDNGKLQDFMDETPLIARRQDIPTVYRLNGAIYISKTDILLNNRNWYTDNTRGYIMDRIASVDIDDIYDFKYAEFVIKEKFYE